MSNTHQPGVCNIGPAEISRRKQGAYFGLALTLLWFIALHFMKANRALYLTEFFPSMAFTIGWNQARSKFCVAFGLMGVFNFGPLGKESELQKVESLDLRAIDRKFALNLIAKSALWSVLITAALVLLG